MSKDVEDKINKFLEENKITVKGGTITSEEQLSSVLNKLAIGDLNKGKHEKALYLIDKAIEFNPENYNSLFIKGIVFRDAGKYNEAIEVFKEYCDVSNDAISYIYIGLCYAGLNDIENSLDFLRKGEKELSEKEKENNSDLMCTVYECIGNIYMNKENVLEFSESDKLSFNYKLAVKYYKMSLKININNHILLNKLAACYYHFEDESKALYCYEKAVEIAPENAAYLEAVEEMKGMGITAEKVEF